MSTSVKLSPLSHDFTDRQNVHITNKGNNKTKNYRTPSNLTKGKSKLMIISI
jgi:hypothetical protein